MKIIAEAGVNHDGNVQRALELVDAASEAGAHAVKFQTFKADLLTTSSADKADYQKHSTPGDESQQDMIRKLELTQDQFCQVAEHCRRRNIEFLSTAFETVSLQFLHERLGLRTFKIASGELTNAPLLLAHARLADSMIVSTGMATMPEIRQALGVIAFGMEAGTSHTAGPGQPAFEAAFERAMQNDMLCNKVTLLHCTTEYPAPMDQINLRAMHTMSEAYGLPVGYSDHTLGITIPVAAAALGATVIEKHFTLDKSLPGPDHAMSLDPAELADMVCAIKATVSALGEAEKKPGNAERRNIEAVRKSLVASCDIRAGELFTEHNLCIKRPGSGLPPAEYWNLLGQASNRDYSRDDFIR